jgi:hypothetical protein
MSMANRSEKIWVPLQSFKLLEPVRYLHNSLQSEEVYVYPANAFVWWVA